MSTLLTVFGCGILGMATVLFLGGGDIVIAWFLAVIGLLMLILAAIRSERSYPGRHRRVR